MPFVIRDSDKNIIAYFSNDQLKDSGKPMNLEYVDDKDMSVENKKPSVRVTASQFHRQLIIDGKDESVLPAIDAIEDEVKRKLIKARYLYEIEFHSDDDDLLLLAYSVGYNTDSKINKFFDSASKL